MKTTYLIYKQVDGKRQLVVATQDEWGAILEKNMHLPEELRRHFILDCIVDGDEVDRMYIEVTKAEHSEWNSRHTVAERKRKEGNLHTIFSLDAPVRDTDLNNMHEGIPSEFDLERIANDHVLLEELKRALEAWKPWANDLLNYYLSERGRSCTSDLCKRYGLNKRAVMYRKAAFKKFVKDFLK